MGTVLSVLYTVYTDNYVNQYLEEKSLTIGAESVNLFLALDEDGDLQLSIDEAKVLLQYYTQAKKVTLHANTIHSIKHRKLSKEILYALTVQ